MSSNEELRSDRCNDETIPGYMDNCLDGVVVWVRYKSGQKTDCLLAAIGVCQNGNSMQLEIDGDEQDDIHEEYD